MAKDPEKASENFQNFGKAMIGFDKLFEEEFNQYCDSKAQEIPCELFRFSESITIQEIVGTLVALIKHIISNCQDGFGFLWLEQLDALGRYVGGPFPQIIIPVVSELEIEENSFTIPFTNIISTVTDSYGNIIGVETNQEL